ncbi:hypothetical protein EW146_g3182 [Bondarzewia mesenterica]|uniref:ER membrane protein complex subunit 1 n=1 Tax=Bondarzewia mesenterica TaxID=1095465 RepID=A0A4S4LYM1_9AGAM|nr:hypothetical protein EW146_g3182 [Bondarzewia mesenterica]
MSATSTLLLLLELFLHKQSVPHAFHCILSPLPRLHLPDTRNASPRDRQRSLVFIASWLTVVYALHESEAGIVDWYQANIGVPLSESLSTGPSFHSKHGQPPTEGLLLSATSSNVLAALNAGNGSVAWRYVYGPSDNVIYYQRNEDVVACLSGPGGAILRLLDYSTGDLLVERPLHQPDDAPLLEPDGPGASIAFLSTDEQSTKLFVLTNGYILQCVDRSGEVQWTWKAPDQTSLVLYSKVIATHSTIYLIGVAKSFASYTLTVTTISPLTGEVLATADIPSSISDGPFGLISLQDVLPRVVWLEAGSIRSVQLTPELKEKPASVKGAAYDRIIDVGLGGRGHFVALKSDGSGRVLKLDTERGGLKVIWEFSDSARSDRHAESLYMGGLDKDGRPYIGRVFWSHKASAHIYAPHLAEGKGLVSGFTFNFDTNTHGIISHAALYAAYQKDYDVLPYIALTTTTGAVQLWQGDKVQWTREESLAHIRVAEMIELPERKTIASHVGDGRESFSQRLKRQLSDARDFPAYISHFIKRFATGSYASATSRAAPVDVDASEPISRDEFGFRKIIVTATDMGKVYGLDSSNGEILWSRVLGLGWAAQVGGRIIPMKLFATTVVSDGKEPQVVLITQRKAENGLVDTVVFHIDALTGEDATGASSSNEVLPGVDIISGPLIESYMLQGQSKMVILLDEFRQVYLYPDTSDKQQSFTTMAPSLYLPLRTGEPGRRQFTGHQIALDSGLGGKAQAYPVWATSLPPLHEILAVVPRPSDPVASVGKVLGNRTTLYKYLNPHLFAVLTTCPHSCGVHVLDGAKGSLVYSATVGKGSGACDIKATFVENWLVYVYWDSEFEGVGMTKGYRVVSVELYEGRGVDDKTSSSDMSSFSNRSTAVNVFEQSFIFPHGITAIATTSTKFGVTMKDIIVANVKHQIQSFPRRMLDPRRPKQKPTSEEQEEFLFQYDPVIPDDSRRVLSHNYEVANIRRILTSPAQLESTSLVFAYGLDLFFTRTAPSGTFDVLSDNFNKVQLVLTVCGLAAAIIITKPMAANTINQQSSKRMDELTNRALEIFDDQLHEELKASCWGLPHPQPLQISTHLHLHPTSLALAAATDDSRLTVHYWDLSRELLALGEAGASYPGGRELARRATGVVFEWTSDAVREARVVLEAPKGYVRAEGPMGWEVVTANTANGRTQVVTAFVKGLSLSVLLSSQVEQRDKRQRVIVDIWIVEEYGVAEEVDYCRIFDVVVQDMESSSHKTMEKIGAGGHPGRVRRGREHTRGDDSREEAAHIFLYGCVGRPAHETEKRLHTDVSSCYRMMCNVLFNDSGQTAMKLFFVTVPVFATLFLATKADTVVIPKSSFDNYTNLEKYWSYLYPWGSDHNGSARMVGNSTNHDHISVANGVLTLKAMPTSNQPASTAAPYPAIHYFSGTIYANEQINVDGTDAVGYTVSGEFIAPTAIGTWPAFWLTAVEGWPPESDIGEWKGTQQTWFNTFNTSSQVHSTIVDWPTDGAFHSVSATLRTIEGSTTDLSIEYFLDGVLKATDVAANFRGAAMWLIIDLQVSCYIFFTGMPGTQVPCGLARKL